MDAVGRPEVGVTATFAAPMSVKAWAFAAPTNSQPNTSAGTNRRTQSPPFTARMFGDEL
jgi:hypothetical protein